MQTDPLKELDKKISEYEQKYSAPTPKKELDKGASFVVAEIVAGISIGGIVGYYLDYYFQTKILFILIFVILGLISSLYNIYKKCK